MAQSHTYTHTHEQTHERTPSNPAAEQQTTSQPTNKQTAKQTNNQTAQAARLAGLSRVALLQEPVAAALAFGYGKPFEAETVLVFDLGGGTYDVSVLDSFEGIMEVCREGRSSPL